MWINVPRLYFFSEETLLPMDEGVCGLVGIFSRIHTCCNFLLQHMIWWFAALRMGNFMRWYLIQHILLFFLLHNLDGSYWLWWYDCCIMYISSTELGECTLKSFSIWDVIKPLIFSLQSAKLRAATGRYRSPSLGCSSIVLTGHCCSCCWCCWLPRDCIHGPSSHRHGDGPRGGQPMEGRGIQIPPHLQCVLCWR